MEIKELRKLSQKQKLNNNVFNRKKQSKLDSAQQISKNIPFNQETRDQTFSQQNQFFIVKKDDEKRINKARKRIITQNLNDYQLKKERQYFLPSINKQKLQNKKMLIQLYQKKISLSKRLQKIDKYIILQKSQIISQFHSPSDNPQNYNIVNNNLQSKHAKIQKKYTHPENINSSDIGRQRLGDLKFGKKNHLLPESMRSVEKNKQILQFIKSMHKDSIQRSLKRIEKSNKSMQQSYHNICLNCSRTKCKKEVFNPKTNSNKY